MLVKTLAILCGCALVVQAAKSSPKPIDAAVRKIVDEALSQTQQGEHSAIRTCGMHFGGYEYKTYQQDLQREGTTYYVTVDVKFPRDNATIKDKQLVVFKPKGSGKAKVTKSACE